jgi:pimeloyl-ACP methyl ester carboxylesterase
VVVDAMTPKFTTVERLQKAARELMEKQKPAAFIGALKAMAERIDTTSLLAGIDIPVVVIHGDADLLIPVDRAREVRELVPQAYFVELKGVGHLPMMEAVQETAAALKHFA